MKVLASENIGVRVPALPSFALLRCCLLASLHTITLLGTRRDNLGVVVLYNGDRTMGISGCSCEAESLNRAPDSARYYIDGRRQVNVKNKMQKTCLTPIHYPTVLNTKSVILCPETKVPCKNSLGRR